jgi:hypothetical protein
MEPQIQLHGALADILALNLGVEGTPGQKNPFANSRLCKAHIYGCGRR